MDLSFKIIASRKNNRHPIAHLTPFSSNYIRVLNPFMPMWWAFAMPGTGHMMLGKMLNGFLLFGFEFLVNTKTHLNQAIIYSMTGQFQLEKDTIDLRWFLVYIGVYIFSVWDSYRLTTDINQFSMLAIKEKGPIHTFKLGAIEINFLQRVNPWLAVIWSAVTPGLGHILLRHKILGFYLLIWHITIVYKSHLSEAVYYSFIGEFQRATAIMDLEWTLFIPSVYIFAICDTYYRSIELNKLFKMEQARFLQENYNPVKTGLFLKEWVD